MNTRLIILLRTVVNILGVETFVPEVYMPVFLLNLNGVTRIWRYSYLYNLSLEAYKFDCCIVCISFNVQCPSLSFLEEPQTCHETD